MKRSPLFMRSLLLMTALLLTSLLVACGGGGGGVSSAAGSRAGSLMLTVKWPTPSRLIPLASNTIQAVLTSGSQTLGSQLLARPTTGTQTSVTFDHIPVGSVTLTCTAYPNADGTGVAQATGAAPATIFTGRTTPVTVTMGTTIDHLTVTPANPTINVGATQALTMTAYDLAGNIVLTAPQNVAWNSATPAKVTITASGTATGVAVGTSQVTVSESESGKSANTTVTVAAQQQQGCVPGDVTGPGGLGGGVYSKFGGPSLGNWNHQTAANGGVGNTIAWTVQTGVSGTGVPICVNGPSGLVVLVCSYNDQSIRAIRPQTGTILWTFVADGGLTCTPAVGTNGRIYVASLNSTYALDMNGNQIWKSSPGGQSITIGLDGTLYGFNSNGTTAMDPSNGNVLWHISGTNAGYSHVAPSVDSHGHLICATYDQQHQINLTQVDGKCGTTIWRVPLHVNAATVGPDDTIYATVGYGATTNTSVVAVNPTDGSIKWTANVPVQPTPPAFDTINNRLFVLGNKGTMTCLNSVTGAVLWTFNVPNTLPNSVLTQGSPMIDSTGHVVFVASYKAPGYIQTSTVFFLHGNDGSVLFSKDLNAGASADFATPVFDGIGQVIIRDNNTGVVYALE